VNYFPAQQADLDAAFSRSSNAIMASAQAKAGGIATGEAAAAALIASRAGDGLEANVPYSPGTGPGIWQPTPPGFLPPLTPWLGQMRPFIMKSPAQFLPDGPTALTSEEWVAELNATGLFGDVNSTIPHSGNNLKSADSGGAYRAAVQSRLRQPCCKLRFGRHEFGAAAGDALDGLRRCRHRMLECQVQVQASGDRSQRSVRVAAIPNSQRIRIGLHLALRPINRNIRRLMVRYGRDLQPCGELFWDPPGSRRGG